MRIFDFFSLVHPRSHMLCSTTVSAEGVRVVSDRSESSASGKDVNRAVYESPRVYRYYLSQQLTPSEAACLLKYQPQIAGCDVLDVGVGRFFLW